MAFSFNGAAGSAIGAGIMLAGLLVGIYYILSKVLNAPQISARFNLELNELFITVVIVIAVIVVDALLSPVLGNAVYSASSIVRTYIKNLISILAEVYYIEFLAGLFGNFGFSFGIKAASIEFLTVRLHVAPGLDAIMDWINKFIDVIEVAIGVQLTQYMALTLIAKSIPTIIFPFGVLLRAFPFTRTTGSTIIAFSLAAYFIYPAGILFTNEMVKSFEKVYPPRYSQGVGSRALGMLFDVAAGMVQVIPSDFSIETNAYMLENDWKNVVEKYDYDNQQGHFVSNSYTSYKVSSELNPLSDNQRNLVPGFFDSLANLADFILVMFTLPLLFYKAMLYDVLPLTSTLAAYTLAFVLNFVIFISGFKAVSEAMRGETALIGLSRMV